MPQNQLKNNYCNKNESLYERKVKKLKNYFWIIQNLLDELIRNQDDSSIIKAAQLSGMPKSQVIRTLDDIYYARVKSQEKISDNIKQQMTKKLIIENAINKIEDPQLRYVLKNKYLLFKSLEEIALNLNKSYKQISRWHTQAINNINIEDLNY